MNTIMIISSNMMMMMVPIIIIMILMNMMIMTMTMTPPLRSPQSLAPSFQPCDKVKTQSNMIFVKYFTPADIPKFTNKKRVIRDI